MAKAKTIVDVQYAKSTFGIRTGIEIEIEIGFRCRDFYPAFDVDNPEKAKNLSRTRKAAKVTY